MTRIEGVTAGKAACIGSPAPGRLGRLDLAIPRLDVETAPASTSRR